MSACADLQNVFGLANQDARTEIHPLQACGVKAFLHEFRYAAVGGMGRSIRG